MAETIPSWKSCRRVSWDGCICLRVIHFCHLIIHKPDAEFTVTLKVMYKCIHQTLQVQSGKSGINCLFHQGTIWHPWTAQEGLRGQTTQQALALAPLTHRAVGKAILNQKLCRSRTPLVDFTSEFEMWKISSFYSYSEIFRNRNTGVNVFIST